MIIIIQILFFLLVPIGIWILVKAIKLVQKTFNGNVVLEIPYSQKEAHFESAHASNYAVWQKGKLFRRTPIDKFAVEITNLQTQQQLAINRSTSNAQVNGFGTGRMEILKFKAPAGKYRLQLVEGSSASTFEKVLLKMLPNKAIDYSHYFLQIRESQPSYIVFLAIPLFIIAGFLIIGGLVLGVLAKEVVSGY